MPSSGERLARLLAPNHQSPVALCLRPPTPVQVRCIVRPRLSPADFLRDWADSLARRGLRTDQITLRMTRAEIGNYLGMTLETVSRALSRLARQQLIGFDGRGRRDIRIPDVAALAAFVQNCVAPETSGVTLQ